MKIVNEALLDTFRNARRCEWCYSPNRGGLDPAHVFARGRGSATRMDIPENLLALCRECHNRAHTAEYSRDDLLHVIAWREKMLFDDLLDFLLNLRWQQTP